MEITYIVSEAVSMVDAAIFWLNLEWVLKVVNTE